MDCVGLIEQHVLDEMRISLCKYCKDPTGKVTVLEFSLTGTHEIANTPHTLGMPHRPAQVADFSVIEIWRTHDINRGERDHLHVVRRVDIVLFGIEQMDIRIHQV